MKIVEYNDKEQKTKQRAVDILSLLHDMDTQESLNGTYSAEKVAENYHAIKTQLYNALYAEEEKQK